MLEIEYSDEYKLENNIPLNKVITEEIKVKLNHILEIGQMPQKNIIWIMKYIFFIKKHNEFSQIHLWILYSF